MQRTFGVTLDPATQVNHSIGSKPALAMLPACFINPGDITLMTVPGYPVAGTHTRYYGGSVFRLPLLPENNFFPDFASHHAGRLAADQAAGPQLSQQPDRQDRDARVLRASDRPGQAARVRRRAGRGPRPLVLRSAADAAFSRVPGAMDVGVEVHSLSKGFDMIGWRIGWVCGHERIVRAFADVKDNSDSGQFGAIQNAAAFASGRRRDSRAGRGRSTSGDWKSSSPCSAAAAFDARCPAARISSTPGRPSGLADGTKFENAEAASQYLITQHSIVTVPWDDAGPFLRFSVTYEAADEAAEDALMAAAADRLKLRRLVF